MLFKYIAGNKFKHALQVSNYILNKNKIPIINFAIESNYPKPLINKEFSNIINNIDSNIKISFKLSLFDYNIDILNPIIEKLIFKNVKILIDAENANNYKKYSVATNNLIDTFNRDSINIYKTYQMTRTDSYDELMEDTIKFDNLGIKMVRGAYYNEDKDKVNNGLPVLYQNKFETDSNYNKAIIYLSENYENKSIILATHNKESIKLGYNFNCYKNKNIFEFAHLMGMNQNYYKFLINQNYCVNVYIPYGPYKYTIPYLTRRLYENLDYLKYMY